MDQFHASFDEFQAESPSLPDNHIIGILIHDGVTVFMQGVQETAFPDDECRPARFLAGQKTSRCYSARKNMLDLDLDSHLIQFGPNISSRALAVVGKQ